MNFIKLISLFLTFLLISVCYSSNAQSKIFHLKENKIFISVPTHWQSANNFLGNPLTLFGRPNKNIRPVLIFNDAKDHSFNLKTEKLDQSQSIFFSHRHEWVEKRHGIFKSKVPYKLQKWSGLKKPVHSIGIHYSLNGQSLKEMSYFVECGQAIIGISEIVPATTSRVEQKTIEKVKNSIECR